MAEVPISVIFTATIIAGAVAIFFAFNATKFAVSANKESLWVRAIAFVIIAFGFSFHTAGDFLQITYGWPVEHMMESIAHVVLLAGFVTFLISAQKLLSSVKEFKFN